MQRQIYLILIVGFLISGLACCRSNKQTKKPVVEKPILFAGYIDDVDTGEEYEDAWELVDYYCQDKYSVEYGPTELTVTDSDQLWQELPFTNQTTFFYWGETKIEPLEFQHFDLFDSPLGGNTVDFVFTPEDHQDLDSGVMVYLVYPSGQPAVVPEALDLDQFLESRPGINQVVGSLIYDNEPRPSSQELYRVANVDSDEEPELLVRYLWRDSKWISVDIYVLYDWDGAEHQSISELMATLD